MDDPDPGSKTTPARASPLKRYVPQRKRADGTFENSNMGGSVHLIAPDPVERAAHRASIRSQLPPAITRPPPSTEYGRSCVKQMETELLQKILNIERNATNREAKERRAQGLKVSDDDDDAKWIAAGFENWPEKRFDDLLVSMDRRHAEAGARFEARRKERRDEFTKENRRTPNNDAEVDVWFEVRREARRKARREKRMAQRRDEFIKEKGRTPNDDAEVDVWFEARRKARREKLVALRRDEFTKEKGRTPNDDAEFDVWFEARREARRKARREKRMAQRRDEFIKEKGRTPNDDAEVDVWFEARRKARREKLVALRRDEFTKENRRTPNDDAEVDVWFEARREARREKRVALRLDAFIEENGRAPNDDAEFDEWKAAIDAARNTKATTNFMSKLKQYNPDVPTVGWLVEVSDRRRLDQCDGTRTSYTTPPMLAGERTDVKAKRGLQTLPEVWAYCEARWGAPVLLRVVSARDAARNAARDAARNTKATTNFMSKLKQYNPDVPTVGWLVEVSDRGQTVRNVYTPPPVLAGERTDVKIKRGKRGGKQGLRTLPDVWAYCEARWGAPTTVKAPVKRQMTLGFAVAPKKPRVE